MFRAHNRRPRRRLYVDRVFSLRGIGTVATGTLWSGSIGAGDVLRAEPGGRDVRVRSVQVHDRPVERAEAGPAGGGRASGRRADELRRGDALVAPGAFATSYRLDVALEELEPIADGARLTSTTAPRRSRPGSCAQASGYAQLRLAAPVVAARGDRVVLRGETTVGGGTVIDPAPRAPRRRRALRAGRARREDRARARARRRRVASSRTTGSRSCVPSSNGGSTRPTRSIRAWTRPSSPGRRTSCARLPFERQGSKLYRRGDGASLGEREAEAAALEAELEAAAPAPVKVDGRRAGALPRAGRAGSIRLGDGYAVSAAAYERARALVVEECESAGRIALARFRDLAGCGRRDAQLLLERLDADGVTRRVGDERVLRRR